MENEGALLPSSAPDNSSGTSVLGHLVCARTPREVDGASFIHFTQLNLCQSK